MKRQVILVAAGTIFLTAAPSLCSASCVEPPPGLIAWWPGDGNGNDISGNGQIGVLRGGVSFSTGKVDEAFLFDGVDGRVEVSDSPFLRFGTGELTVDAWIKAPPGSGEFRAIVGKEQQSFPFPSMVFRLSDQGKLQFAVTDCGTGACGFSGPGGGGTRQPIESQTRLDDDVLHHIAGVRHASGYELYVDGLLVATRTEPARNSDNSAPLFLGMQGIFGPDGIGIPFEGIVDEVEIFDRALVASEIFGLFAAGSAGKCKSGEVCHKPGTAAEKTLELPIQALAGHLRHGDTIGSCE